MSRFVRQGFDGHSIRLIGPRHSSPGSLPWPECDNDHKRKSYSDTCFPKLPRGHISFVFCAFVLCVFRSAVCFLRFVRRLRAKFSTETKDRLPIYLRYPCWKICLCGKRSCPLPALALVCGLSENIVHACSESTNKQRRSQTVFLNTLISTGKSFNGHILLKSNFTSSKSNILA